MNFECHITCDLTDAAVCTAVAAEHNWKTSKIDGDPVLGDRKFFYLTAHAASYGGIKARMDNTVRALKLAGAEVLRQKIEMVVLDTKTGVGINVSVV